MLTISSGDFKIESRLLKEEAVNWIIPRPFVVSPKDHLAEALDNPVDAKPLSKESFNDPLLIFADDTRLPSPFVPRLVRELEKKTDNLRLMIASGTHVLPKDDYAKNVLGEELFSRYKGDLIYSSTRNPSCEYEFVGRTTRGTEVELNTNILDSDFILSTLCVRPHYFAGWEGGAKALLPGCSSSSAISKNHSYVIGNPKAKELVISGNPVREDINEVPGLLENKRGLRYRILDFVPDLNNKPVGARYGAVVKAHSELAGLGRRISVIETRTYPLVIAVAEGAVGRNFYQSLKAAAHCSSMVRPANHGKPALILAGRMDMGIGSEVFKKEFETYIGMDPDLVKASLKERAEEGTFNETLQKINRMIMFLPELNFMVVSPEATPDVEAMLKSKGLFFSRSLDEALETQGTTAHGEVAVVPNGNATVPLPVSQ